eukprot:13425381-Alexandrium_andersonii.AAC.1
MSASLVGSEMCIRDRAHYMGVNEVIDRMGLRSIFDVEAADPTVQTQPVSYTHLTLPTICSV